LSQPLRVLQIEDLEDDALLIEHELRRGGWEPRCRRVDTAPAMREALAGASWDIVISDFGLPRFDAPSALSVLQEFGTDVPFIIVSGTITEEAAVAAMKAGAHDYVTKTNLRRLVPAVRRELREAETRRERRSAEEQKLRAEARFGTLVDSLEGLVFTVDEAGIVEGVYGRGLGPGESGRDDFLGRHLDALVGAAGAGGTAACARALAGERVELDWIREHAGAAQHLHLSLSPMTMAGSRVRGLVGLVRDVTAERRLQAKLLETDRLAAIGALAAGVGHEINNPLGALMANLDAVGRELASLDESHDAALAAHAPTLARVHEGLRDVHEAALRVRQVARDLRMVSHSTDERREPVPLERVLDSSIRMAWNDLRQRARLERDYQPVPPVSASEARLGQVFLNLLINATHAIPAGDAEGNVVRVSLRPHGPDHVLVEIADSGAGMSEAVKQRLFTPFFTTKPEGTGTGLGLSICQRIVTGLGGSISAESTPGHGATFRVLLPVAAGVVPPLPLDEPAVPAPVPPAARARVLLVDDEAIMRRAVQRAIGPLHDVTTVASGHEALELIAGGVRFDVIFCDLTMPGMTGIELFATITDVAPEQAGAIAFLTGGAFSEGSRAFLESLPNPILEKPFEPAQLLALIADHAARAQAKPGK
jgi:signal transduction histidine kinase